MCYSLDCCLYANKRCKFIVSRKVKVSTCLRSVAELVPSDRGAHNPYLRLPHLMMPKSSRNLKRTSFTTYLLIFFFGIAKVPISIPGSRCNSSQPEISNSGHVKKILHFMRKALKINEATYISLGPAKRLSHRHSPSGDGIHIGLCVYTIFAWLISIICWWHTEEKYPHGKMA